MGQYYRPDPLLSSGTGQRLAYGNAAPRFRTARQTGYWAARGVIPDFLQP